MIGIWSFHEISIVATCIIALANAVQNRSSSYHHPFSNSAQPPVNSTQILIPDVHSNFHSNGVTSNILSPIFPSSHRIFFKTEVVPVNNPIQERRKTNRHQILHVPAVRVCLSQSVPNFLNTNNNSQTINNSLQHNFLFRSNSSLPYSFADVGQQAAAIATLAPYCAHKEPDTSWLKCDVANNQYVYNGGTYGVVIFGSIMNDGRHGIRVYRNSRLSRTTGSLVDIDFQESHLIPFSSTPLPIVIKVNTQETEARNNEGYFNETSAMEKEVRRSRIATSFHFPNDGSQIIPDLYDIKVTRTGRAHPLFSFAYIQQKVVGTNAHSLLMQVADSQAVSMLDNLNRLLQRFQQYLDALKLERRDRLRPNTRRKYSPPYFEAFKYTFDRAKKELWLRARIRLTIVSLVYEGAYRMWESGMIHCDSHWGNIMLLSKTLKDPKELIDIKKSGKAFIPVLRLYLSEVADIPPQQVRQLRSGVTIYPLGFEYIKWIDTANALPVKAILDDIIKVKGGGDPAKLLYGPCSVYREQMPEDFVELQREGSDLALGGKNLNFTSLFERAKKGLPLDKASTTRGPAYLYNLYIKALPTYQPSLSSTIQSQGTHVWKPLFQALRLLDAEVARIHSIFEKALGRLREMPQIAKCKGVRNYAEPRGQRLREVVRDPRPWSRAEELVGTGCSLADMKIGVLSMRSLLEEAASQFPDYAPVHFPK